MVQKTLQNLIDEVENGCGNIPFKRLLTICAEVFDKPLINKGSHLLFKTPWPEDPRLILQKTTGKAAKYQVRQVLKAMKRFQKRQAHEMRNEVEENGVSGLIIQEN